MITPPTAALWLILIFLIPFTAAQTVANCTDPQYSWMFNSIGQSPCYVAEQLVQPCNSQGFNIPSLQAGSGYPGLTTGQTNACTCTSVFYSLLSACAACQNGTVISWTRFITNCTSTWSMVYSKPIPARVRVPHWAYLDVSNTGNLSVLAAKTTGGPKSTSHAPTSTSSSQSSSSTGAIAGGVVGGVVGVALIAGVAIFFYRRRGRHRSDHSNGLMSGPDVLSTSPPPSTAWNTSPLGPALPPQKLYDPQDPSTFPPKMYTSMPQSLTGTTYTTTDQDTPQPAPSTHYAGAPEVY